MVKDGFKIGSRVSPAPGMFSVEFDDKWDPLSCIFKFALIILDEQNDSNLLSSDHKVISDVLHEELGPGHHDVRFPPNLRNSGRMSSDCSTIGEPELSSIPKCSDIPSSRNSDVDSNSTDEIIRESELLERQLSRDYPSLQQLRDQREPGHHATNRAWEPEKDLGLSKDKLSKARNETPSLNVPVGSGLGGLNSGRELGVGKKFDQETGKMSQKLGAVDGIRKGQKNDAVFEYRGNLGRSDGISEAVDNGPNRNACTIRGTSRPKTGRTLDHKGTLRDINVHGRSEGISEVADNVPRFGGVIRNGQSTGATRNIDVTQTGNSNGADNVHVLNNSIRKPVAIPTGSAGISRVDIARDSDGFALGGGGMNGVRPTVDEGRYRDYLRESESNRQKSTLVGEKHKPCLVEHDDSGHKPLMNSRPDTASRKKNTQDTVMNREGLSTDTQATKSHHGLVRKSGFEPQEGNFPKSGKGLRANEAKKISSNAGGLNLSKVATRSKQSSRLVGEDQDYRESNTRSEDKKIKKSVLAKSRLGVGRVNRGGRGSPKDINGHDGGKKGKKNKRPRGVVGNRRGSRGEDTMKGKEVGRKKGANVQSGKAGDSDSSVQKRTEATEATKEHTDGSESSGVFWDDQISPLDVSERLRNPSQGLAFDEVGLAKKSREYEARQGLGKSKDSRDSPVIRHYHHHFHHESSEDLVRDVDMSERTRQIAGTKNLPGLGSSFNRSDRRDLNEESSHVPRKERMVKKDEPKKRSVKFDDHVSTLLITNRLERLRRDMDSEDDKEIERRSQIRSDYSGYLERLNKEHKRMEKELKQRPKKTKRASPYKKKYSVSAASRDRARTNQRKARYPSTKARKRSSSTSPKIRVNKRKAAKQLEKGDIILPTLLDEFPFLHLSPHTLQTMRRKQTQQLTSLSKTAQADKRQTKTQKVIEDAEKRQETLLKILRKDLQHNQRMHEQKERNEQDRAIKSKLREKRHATARARRYYEDYQLRMRARMLKRRTREEQIFKNLFEDGLEIQKQRVHELRTYAKEQREKRAVRQQNELESLENYYRDQYSILAEAIAQEKETLLVREKAQEKVIHQMQRNLRTKLQNEVTEIQETLVRDEDDAYFRRLDAERLRRQLQMTAFQNLT
ncbi:centrosomal of 95 kDa-like [Paramuricea clavata]|uniref:Centrosomal of 95 kDa-like n=1 Tax=Paramuricea clavata TaxID=317549 RepID=A0A6S7HF76_PARCT|nr:centrosomal of 95 kDa-like [Paramuricea clavata]